LRKVIVFSAVTLVFALSLSCGGDDDGPGPTPEPEWEKMNVSTAASGVAISLVLDGDGGANMVFIDNSGTSLFVYAYYKDDSLEVSATGSSSFGVCHDATMALDDGGGRHGAFYGGQPHQDLIYRNIDRGGFDVVDSDGNVGRWASIAAGANQPYICYYDVSHGDLRCARYTGTRWQIENVDGNGDTGLYPSAVVDAGGNPHVAYYDRTARSLRYARRDKNNWTLETVDATRGCGKRPALVLDGSGVPHVVYNDGPNGRLKYASREGGNWTTASLPFSVEGDTGSGFALDSSGQRYLAFYDSSSQDLRRRRSVRARVGRER
jgi:hypothetical protein